MFRLFPNFASAVVAAGILVGSGSLGAADPLERSAAVGSERASPGQTMNSLPGRETYFYVDTLEPHELAELHNAGAVHVIDVRSRFEYETLRIDGAHHVNVEDRDFVEQVLAIHEQNPAFPVAFYCRGESCFRAYQAAERMLSQGFQDAYSMDAGIYAWADQHPEATAMFGSAPLDPDHLIDDQEFGDRLLAPDEFASRAHSGQYRVLDLRRPFERDQIGLFLQHESNITTSESSAMSMFLSEVKDSGDPLLVYDITGGEVRLFQYVLARNEISDYYFMDGGFKNFRDTLLRDPDGGS